MPIQNAKNCPINCGLATSTFSRTFAKPPISDEPFALTASKSPRQTSSGQSSVATTVNDVTVLRSSSASFVEDVVATVTQNAGKFDAIQFASDTPSTVTGSGESQSAFTFPYSSNGYAVVRATSPSGFSALASVSVSSVASGTIDVFGEWVAGSFAKHSVGQFVSRAVAGKTTAMFASKTHSPTPSYTRNQSSYLYDVDMSCISPWNSVGGQQRAGTLITPRHALFATHFPISVGATVRFVRQLPNDAGQLPYVDRVVESVQSVHDDLQIARLSADVPYAIAKVMPSNTLAKISQVQPGRSAIAGQPRMPLVAATQDKTVVMVSLGGLSTWLRVASVLYGINVDGSQSLEYSDSLRQGIREGDSGSPLFFLVNGELALAGIFYSSSSGASIGTQANHDNINGAISALGPSGHQLTPVDLSGFTTY